MPIPPLSPHGLLPTGFFDCTLDEVSAHYTWSPRRAELWDRFRRFIDWLNERPPIKHPYLDGGFTSNKAHPGDIDVVIDLSGADQRTFGFWLTVFATERKSIAENFLVDFWVYHPSMPNDLRAFFQYVRPEEAQARQLKPTDRKGLLRVSL